MIKVNVEGVYAFVELPSCCILYRRFIGMSMHVHNRYNAGACDAGGVYVTPSGLNTLHMMLCAFLLHC